MQSSHPSELELRQFASGDLADGRFEEVAAHLEGCESCGELLRKPGAFKKLGANKSTEVHQPISERPGSVVGPYKLLQKLGEGGMGAVYMAEQEKPVRRMVALKIIKPGMDSRQVIARFEAERQALAMMDHHHIAKVLDAGTTDTGRPYFAMELVKGVPITEYCDKNKLTPRERLEMFIPVCQAIQHAHQKGIIHRDIKPSNVLVTLYDGKPVPKVIDFGIAKATQQKLTERTMFTGIGQILGTFEYMSPEQAEMNQLDVDTRTDVYSLGVMLYELLTGTTPITKDKLRNVGLEEMLRTIRETEPPKPSTRLSDSAAASPSVSSVRKTEPGKLSKFVRGDLDWIVMKALEKDRTRRYETANGLAADVQRFLNDEAVAACPPSASYKFRKFARRNKAMLATGTAIAGILLVSTFVSTGLAIWAVRAEQKASENEAAATSALAAEQKAREEEQQQRELAVANAAKAKREAAKSREVAAFLTAMLEGVGPSVARGRDTKMLTEILDKTAERIETDLANQPEIQSELHITIGNVRHDLGQHEQAEQHFRALLRIRQQLHGPSHPLVADALEQIGNQLASQSKYGEAEAIYRESLAMSRALFGDTHPDVARSLHSIGNLFSVHLGKHADAEEILRQSLTTYEQCEGDNPFAIAHGLLSLGGSIISQLTKEDEYNERLDEVRSLWQRALDIVRVLDGDEYRTHEAKIYHALAYMSLEFNEDALKGEELYWKAYQARSSVSDGELAAYGYLASISSLQFQQAKYQASLETMQRSMEAANELYGTENSKAAVAVSLYAKHLYNLGHQSEALNVQRDMLVRLRSSLSDNHSAISVATFNLAYFLTSGGSDPRNAQESAELIREAWKIDREAYGEDSQQSSRIARFLSNALCMAGAVDDAVNVINQAALADKKGIWHHAGPLNLLAGEPTRNHAIFRHALDVVDPTKDARAARRAATAILVDGNASAEFMARATAFAEQAAEADNGPKFDLCLAMARYRQRRYAEADQLLEPYLERVVDLDDRERLLALTVSAMSLLQQDKLELANERLDELGMLSVCKIQPPSRTLYNKYLLAAWFLQSELRSLLPEDKFDSFSPAQRMDLGLDRLARHVHRHADDLKAAHDLAVLYAWLRRDEEHHAVCERLMKTASEGDDVEGYYWAAKSFLVCPSQNSRLIEHARALAEKAAASVDADNLTHDTANKLSAYLSFCALAEMRLGNHGAADQLLQKAEPIISFDHRGKWSAIRAMNHSLSGRTEQAQADLEVAELMIRPAPSRSEVSIELIGPSSSRLLLEEAQSLVAENRGETTAH